MRTISIQPNTTVGSGQLPRASSLQHRATRGQARLRVVRGQALLELAVFGMVALAALGFLIKVGMKMNYDQEIRIAAFRRALAAAQSDNGTDQDAMGTVFHYVADRQMPDSTNGSMNPTRERTEASAFVEWGDRLSFAHKIDAKQDSYADSDLGYKTQPLIVVRSNGVELERRQDDFPHDIVVKDGPRTITWLATRGIVKSAQIINTASGHMTHDKTLGSSLSSSVSTTDKTDVQTLKGDSVSGSVGSGTTVNW